MSKVNFGVTEPKLTKFLHDVGIGKLKCNTFFAARPNVTVGVALRRVV